jgi:hypothetical protein
MMYKILPAHKIHVDRFDLKNYRAKRVYTLLMNGTVLFEFSHRA